MTSDNEKISAVNDAQQKATAFTEALAKLHTLGLTPRVRYLSANTKSRTSPNSLSVSLTTSLPT